MSVSAFQDLPLADEDREWDGGAAEKRVRSWADAEDEPDRKYRDAHVWYDKDDQDHFGGYKLLLLLVLFPGRGSQPLRAGDPRGSLHEGGELGSSLPHAYGALLDEHHLD